MPFKAPGGGALRHRALAAVHLSRLELGTIQPCIAHAILEGDVGAGVRAATALLGAWERGTRHAAVWRRRVPPLRLHRRPGSHHVLRLKTEIARPQIVPSERAGGAVGTIAE